MPVGHGVWSPAEHDRFLDAMRLFPDGPWRLIASHVETRNVRQVQTHAQKYNEKIHRRRRGLRTQRHPCLRPEHRIEDVDPIAVDHPLTAAECRAIGVAESLPSLEQSLDILLECLNKEMNQMP